MFSLFLSLRGSELIGCADKQQLAGSSQVSIVSQQYPEPLCADAFTASQQAAGQLERHGHTRSPDQVILQQTAELNFFF